MRDAKEDEILAYLIAGLSPTEAAARANRSASTVYRLLSKPSFCARLHEGRALELRPHVTKLTTALGRAIDKMLALMDDPNVVPSTQLRAAISIADLTVKFAHEVDARHQIAALAARLDEVLRGVPADAAD